MTLLADQIKPEKGTPTMTKDSARRFDSWANPILPHEEMKKYFAYDKKSMQVLNDCMPHMYVVIPTVEIRIYTEGLPWGEVVLIYPGGEKSTGIYPSVRAWEALRRTYRNRKGWYHEKRKNGLVVLRREGRVIRDPSKKFCTPD